MFDLNPNTKIYLCCGSTDMRKGVQGLSLIASSFLKDQTCSGAMFVFRGKSADKIKIARQKQAGFGRMSEMAGLMVIKTQ